MRDRFLAITALFLVLAIAINTATSLGTPENLILEAEVKGEITEATKMMFKEIVSLAEDRGARLVVVKLSTPGGEASAVADIMEIIENSKVPVCIYVYPHGTYAWSGGTYILMSAHIAAMSPGSIIGSCQPVSSAGEPINFTKYVEAYATLMETHARLHCRNVTAARMFVTKNINMGPEQALKNHVIEIIAEDVNDLLSQLPNMKLVKFIDENGSLRWKLLKLDESVAGEIVETITFENIAAASIERYRPGIGVFILNILLNPLIASLLLIIGLFLLCTGIKSPGLGMEIAGVILIILSLMGLRAIGVSATVIILLTLGFILIIAEIKTGIGVLAIAGASCVVLAAFLVFPSPNWLLSRDVIEGMRITLTVTAGICAALFSIVVYKIAELRKLKVKTGAEAFIGAIGVALTDIDPTGEVRVLGEIWRAKSRTKIVKGQKIKVEDREGLTLIVAPAEE